VSVELAPGEIEALNGLAPRVARERYPEGGLRAVNR